MTLKNANFIIFVFEIASGEMIFENSSFSLKIIFDILVLISHYLKPIHTCFKG